MPHWRRSGTPAARQRVVVGFKDASSVSVPVSYYTLLGVPQSGSLHADTVRAAFESLLTAPTQVRAHRRHRLSTPARASKKGASRAA